MRPSVRFDVFKRDQFACVYCGRTPPDVTLEADHLIPRAEGGTDDLDNLVTACWDCNRGKGAVPLSTAPAPVSDDLEERAALIRERERQLRAYNEAKATERERRENDFNLAWEYWFDVWEAEKLPKYHVPWESFLRRQIDVLGIEEVLDAITVTRGKFNRLTAACPKYFGGILRRRRAVIEGRIVPCSICGKELEVPVGEDASLPWHHTACEDKDKDG